LEAIREAAPQLVFTEMSSMGIESGAGAIRSSRLWSRREQLRLEARQAFERRVARLDSFAIICQTSRWRESMPPSSVRSPRAPGE